MGLLTRRHALVVAVFVAACGREATTANPSQSAPVSAAIAPVELEAPGPDDDSPRVALALPLRHAVSFDASRTDSCSQSWATTHWHGQLTISADAEGHATLALHWNSVESGGGWTDTDTYTRSGEQGCELDGRARIESGQLVLEFVFPERSPDAWPPYECQPRFDPGDPVYGFQMRCIITPIELGVGPNRQPTRRVSVFGCHFGEQLPWLLGELIDSSSRMLELADERLHVAAQHGEVGGHDTRDRWLAIDGDD